MTTVKHSANLFTYLVAQSNSGQEHTLFSVLALLTLLVELLGKSALHVHGVQKQLLQHASSDNRDRKQSSAGCIETVAACSLV